MAASDVGEILAWLGRHVIDAQVAQAQAGATTGLRDVGRVRKGNQNQTEDRFSTEKKRLRGLRDANCEKTRVSADAEREKSDGRFGI